jgi:hypothetical protein
MASRLPPPIISFAAGNAEQAFLLPATQQQMGNGTSQYSFTPVSSSSVTMKLKIIHKDSFVCLSHLLEGKKVVVLGHKAQCHPHSSWWASDDSRAKMFDATCDFLFGAAKQEIALSHFVTSPWYFQSRRMMGLGTFSTDIENIPGES